MSTELNREDAKGAILNRAKDDPELDAALNTGHEFQLKLAQETNRHAEAMRGHFSKLFGNDNNVASYIASVGMIFGLAVFAGCLFAAYERADSNTFWGQWAERALAFSASCLAYIFGKGTSASA